MSEPALNLAPAKSTLLLRGAPGGLLVLPLPPVMRFDALRLALRDLFGNPPGRYAGARVRLELAQRDLDLMEVRRVVHMLKDEFDVEVVGLACEPGLVQRMAERELKLKITPLLNGRGPDFDTDDAAPTLSGTRVPADENVTAVALVPPDATIAPAPSSPAAPTFQTEDGGTDLVSPASDDPDDDLGGRVLTVHQTVRSGSCVRFPGDVQVFGDVNPGAQVIAGGNILVLGALKGMAHAGTRDDNAVILAFDLRPTQLRIGRVIGVVPGADPDRAGRAFVPEIAHVVEGAIAVEPYRGKLPSFQSTVFKPTESA